MREHVRGAANREPMRRLSLGTVLTAVNVGLVAAAVLCLVAAAAGLLRRLTDEQALARVGLASSNALRAVQRAGEGARSTARSAFDEARGSEEHTAEVTNLSRMPSSASKKNK